MESIIDSLSVLLNRIPSDKLDSYHVGQTKNLDPSNTEDIE